MFAAREQYRLADIFLRAAYLKWEHIAPPKAAKAINLSDQIQVRLASVRRPDDREVEKICRDWILGRSLDAQFSLTSSLMSQK